MHLPQKKPAIASSVGTNIAPHRAGPLTALTTATSEALELFPSSARASAKEFTVEPEGALDAKPADAKRTEGTARIGGFILAGAYRVEQN